MKNGLVVLGIAMIVIIIVMIFMGTFNTYGFNQDDDDELILYMNQHRNTGYNTDKFSYERVYLHLSSEDQVLIDLEFANRLIASHSDQNTVEEVIDIINLIKQDILNDIQFEYSYQRYGMMGMNRSNQFNSCGYQTQINSYEWLYIHLDESQRLAIDLLFVESLMMLDLNNLSQLELANEISDIKLKLVDQQLNQVLPTE